MTCCLRWPAASSPGAATSYTIYTGRIFGELDPHNPHNAVITDINLAPTTNGKVPYISNFEIVTPTETSQRTGLMIYEVPNRGGNAISTSALLPGVTYVQSGWQGDLLTQCTTAPVPLYPCTDLNAGPYGTPRNGNTGPTGPQTAFLAGCAARHHLGEEELTAAAVRFAAFGCSGCEIWYSVNPIAPQAAATIQKRSMIFVSDQASSSK